MAKKADDAEVKKECPSCGLGVALDSTVCEFCGWDFEEEDEWILQIEKLERDLILEKQNFEPGTVEHKIESTIHDPSAERIDIIRSRQQQEGTELRPADKVPRPAAKPAAIPPAQTTPAGSKVVREAKASEMELMRFADELRRDVNEDLAPRPGEHDEADEPVPLAPQPSTGKVRRVRTIKASSVVGSSGKGKLVRKVKK